MKLTRKCLEETINGLDENTDAVFHRNFGSILVKRDEDGQFRIEFFFVKDSKTLFRDVLARNVTEDEVVSFLDKVSEEEEHGSVLSYYENLMKEVHSG